MKKKNIQITERKLENIVSKLMVESDARYVMDSDKFMRHKNKDQQYHTLFQGDCFVVYDGNYQIDVDKKFREKNQIPNGVGGTIYHDGDHMYFCPDHGDDRPKRTIQIF